MPTDNLQETLYREYDGLIGLTLLNIFLVAKDSEVIQLTDFDKKDINHLYVLRVALLARDIYGFPVEIKDSWWNVFCLNRKIKKNFGKIKRFKQPKDEPISIKHLLEIMKKDGILHIGENFTFADIYNQYYEGSLN